MITIRHIHDVYLHPRTEQESEVLKLLRELKILNTQTMSKITDIEAQVDALQTKLDAEQQEIQDAINALNATVQELRDQIAGGATDTEALDRIATKLTDITADLEATVTPPTPEEPQP